MITAEEFFNKTEQRLEIQMSQSKCFFTPQDVIRRAMIEFAQLHVEAALLSAWENYEFIDGCDTYGVDLKEESILNAYPKELIK